MQVAVAALGVVIALLGLAGLNVVIYFGRDKHSRKRRMAPISGIKR